MRTITYTMAVALLVACGATSATAEGQRSWLWPFGGQPHADDTSAVTPTPPEMPPEVPNEDDSGTTSMLLPKITWPQFKLPHYDLHVPHPHLPPLLPGREQTDEVRNAWAKPVGEPEQASPWQVVTDGAHRLGTSTRNAWNKTVDVLNPFDEPDKSVAQREPSRPSFWHNLFRIDDDQEQQGPRTITEWMAQERLDP